MAPPTVFPPHTPQMAQGGNKNLQTSATGGNFATLPAQSCRHVTIANRSGTDIEVQQDGAGDAYPVMTGTYFTFYGLSDLSQLAVRRIDQSNAQVTVNARWEA